MDSDVYQMNMALQLWHYIKNCTGIISENVTWDDHLLENCTFGPTDGVQNEISLYDVPTEVVILLSVFYGTISFMTVVGNFFVIWVISTSRRMQNVTNCFIANLALADIMIGLFAIPFQFQAALLQRWTLPEFMCPFCPFVQTLSVTVSIFTLTAIALDRHRAILNPLQVYPSKYRAKICIACIWLVAFLIALPMALALRVERVKYQDSMGNENTKPFCDNTKLSSEEMLSYRVLILLVQYVVPLCIISYVYTRIALSLWGSQTPGNAQYMRDATLMKNKMKVIKMLVIVVVIFAFCWLPLQTYMVLQELFPNINKYRYINIIFFCCDWLAMSNSCYNPFIYGIYNEKFKREFQLRFTFHRRRWRSSNAESVDTDRTLIAGRPSVRSTTTTIDWRSSHQHSTPRNYSYSRQLNGHEYFSPLRTKTKKTRASEKDVYVLQSGQSVIRSASESQFDELCL